MNTRIHAMDLYFTKAVITWLAFIYIKQQQQQKQPVNETTLNAQNTILN